MSKPKLERSYIAGISTKKMVFYSLGGILGGIMYSMFNQLQFYMASLLLIPQTVIALVFLIYSIVDGANDPVFGYLADRSRKYTEKYGKRYPWIMIGTIIAPIFLILCFIPVATIELDASGAVINQEAMILAAIWIILIMCIYESFRTVSEINLSALFPDLFRGAGARRKITSIMAIMGFLNSLIGIVLIPLCLAIFGGVTSTSAYISTVIVIVILAYLLTIPFSIGVKEPADLKQLRVDLDARGKSTSPIKEVLIRVFKDKNWMAFTLAYFCYTVAGYCLLAGINFFVLHSLGLGIEATIIPQLGALLMSIVSIPIFAKISKTIGAKKGYLISLIFMCILFFSMFFVTDITGFTLALFFGGIGLGANGYMYAIISSEAIDNAVVTSGKREEATYNGILRIFSGFCYFLQTLIFAIVSSATGYKPSLGANQSEAAKLGLNLQISLIPLVIMIVGVFIIVLMYNITKEKADANREKLIELKL